jgi:hypothetical protein
MSVRGGKMSSINKDDSKMIGSRSGRRREEKRAELKARQYKKRRRFNAKKKIKQEIQNG